VSPPEHIDASAPAGAGAGTSLLRRAAGAQNNEGVHVSRAARVVSSRMSRYAWGVVGATVLFIALTCWWLTQDRTIPIYDAGDHLEAALLFHQMLQSGNLLGPFNYESPYPFFAPLIGGLAAFIGGVDVAAPIIGENLVFVSLLTLGVYQTGRLLFGAKAGMLAVIFVLGSDLLTAQFHVFMIDPPEAAMVAVSIWLLLASERFKRTGTAGWAGLAVGIGLITKVQYPSFVMGIVAMALVCGGWRNWRGLSVFAAAALVVAAPWYLDHLAQFATFLKVSTANPVVVPGDIPPLLSIANFAWYFWNILNSQLLVALFMLLIGGTAWLIVTLARERRDRSRLASARRELFVGALIAWLFITLTPSHDIRYAIPLLPYIAVIATGWIVHLPRSAGRAAVAVLAVGVVANTLGTTFGVGNTVQLKLVQPLPQGEELADAVTLYSTSGFLVAGPQRDGDVPGLLEALHRQGVEKVAVDVEQSQAPDFDVEGLLPLARIAGLSLAVTDGPEYEQQASIATLLHEPVKASSAPTCARLSDNTGVWVVRYDPADRKLAYYCPRRSPRYYGPHGS
jgi:4-amino-4-deoxy-L-arabinose transferase-like glycosyltransferase